jgi:RES domain-containing protein
LAHLDKFDRSGTHRLIPAKYGAKGVLENLSLPSHVISDLSELDAATNERKIAERGGNPAISPRELLFGVPEAHIVNAAFSHPGPAGGRFNDARRGAWYAGIALDTSIHEVAWHKRRFLRDGRINDRLSFEYQDFLADFAGSFHFLDQPELEACLKPEPVPQCYVPSQALAATLLQAGSAGVIYPSVRHQGGTCIACFRPALVFHPRRAHAYRISVAAENEDVRSEEYDPSESPSPKRPKRRATR